MIPAASSLIYVLVCIVPVLFTRFPRPGKNRDSHSHPVSVPQPHAVIPPPSLLRRISSYYTSSSSSAASSSASDRSSSSSVHGHPTFPPGLAFPRSPRCFHQAGHDIAKHHFEKNDDNSYTAAELTHSEQAELISILQHRLALKNDIIRENSFTALKDRLLLTNRIMKLERMVRDLHDGGSVVRGERQRAASDPGPIVGDTEELKVAKQDIDMSMELGLLGDAERELHTTQMEELRERVGEIERWRTTLPRPLVILPGGGFGADNYNVLDECCCDDDHGLKSPVSTHHERSRVRSIESSLFQLLNGPQRR